VACWYLGEGSELYGTGSQEKPLWGCAGKHPPRKKEEKPIPHYVVLFDWTD